MWLPTSCDVEPVGHGGAVLAFPVPHPLEAMAFSDAPPMDVEGYALAAPLLEPTLSLGVLSSAAAEASLRVAGRLGVVLAQPVPVCALLTRKLNWSVGPKSLLASRFRDAVQPREGTVLLVCGDEVALPHVDFVQSPKV